MAFQLSAVLEVSVSVMSPFPVFLDDVQVGKHDFINAFKIRPTEIDMMS